MSSKNKESPLTKQVPDWQCLTKIPDSDVEVGVAVDARDVVIDKLEVSRQVFLKKVCEGHRLQVAAEVGQLRDVDGWKRTAQLLFV